MKIDLHNHSNYSDGLYSVKELLDHAKKKGVEILALTDHDSAFGVQEAIEYGKKIGIEVIAGIELSTFYNNESVHIVGLFKNNIVPKEIFDKSIEIKEDRRKRAIKMMELIRDIFHVEVDISELLENNVITRGNMYQHILKHNPTLDLAYVNSMVAHSSPAYIEVSKFNTIDGIKFLKENNCIAIYAHPTLNSKKCFIDVLKMGIDGIEYRYPKNKQGEEEYFYNIAKENDLLLSAGSDFHGDLNHAEIGTSTLDYNDYLKIKERLD